nr:YraN family protein [uncultured Acetatifactor sp.]
MNRKEMGAEKERLAAEYLERRGFYVTARNFRCRQGEIDIIGRHEGYLVFVEVKYRSTKNRGSALEAVTAFKQRRICRTADYYRMMKGVDDSSAVRYDVVAIQGEEIFWVINAFPHICRG